MIVRCGTLLAPSSEAFFDPHFLGLTAFWPFPTPFVAVFVPTAPVSSSFRSTNTSTWGGCNRPPLLLFYLLFNHISSIHPHSTIHLDNLIPHDVTSLARIILYLTLHRSAITI